MKKLALVVGEWGECETLVPALQDAGFKVAQDSNFINGMKTLKYEIPRIIIAIEGTETSDEGGWLGAVGHPTHIPIMVIGSGAEDSVVKALILGADAYVPKAFSGEGLMSYVRCLMARSEVVDEYRIFSAN